MGDKKKFATLFSSKDERARDDSSDEDESGQQFYVGGSEHSGQQVVGPPRAPDWAASFIEKLRNSSAAEELSSSSNAPEIDNEEELMITLYNNGIQVGDSPFLDANDPACSKLKTSLLKGEVPAELRKYTGKTVKVKLMHMRRDYSMQTQSFSGQGQRLGDIVVPIQGAGTSGKKLDGVEAQPKKIETDTIKLAQDGVKLREGEPVTQINIRLPDGSRISGRFNHDHTVLDVRNFVVSVNGDLAFQPFSLMMAFPAKVIENEASTLKELDLLNCVLNVKPIYNFNNN